MNFKIIEIKPRIFQFKFKDYYQMSMHFLRYSEFNEGASNKFRNKQFTLIDFMEWYVAKTEKESFLYPEDWWGFNFAGDVIKKVHDLKILDFNKYDQAMLDAYNYCAAKYDDFYVIAARDDITLKHEIAHGMFYLNPDYRKKMINLVKSLNSDFREKMYKDLKNVGYASKVWIDECQAYLATGLYGGANLILKGEDKPFKKVFKQFMEIND